MRTIFIGGSITKKLEFSREEQIFGATINVSTNSAEGLFGRVKTFTRGKGVKRISGRDYGLLMAEYIRRSTMLHSNSKHRKEPL
eukprot:7144729-Karenia_brevis.AAC.1